MDQPPAPGTIDEVIAAIHAAFAGVSRRGGVSWEGTFRVDLDWIEVEEARALSAKEPEVDWTRLVDDETWWPFPGIGGFNFIDSIGFRYYLPPTMIRSLRPDTHDEWYPGHFLEIIERWVDEPGWLDEPDPVTFTPTELTAIAMFVAHMAVHDTDDGSRDVWADHLKARWQKHLPR